MVTLRDEDRRLLTSGVLRIAKASETLVTAALDGRWPFRLIDQSSPRWAGERLWDGNEAIGGIRFGLFRAMLASAEQARGLSELTRSTHGYTVVLATLARGSLEALARANWVLSSDDADSFLIRHASLEYADLRYPAQHQLLVYSRGGRVRVPVDDYRAAVVRILDRFDMKIRKVGMTELATGLLSEIYNEAPELYSGLSASAHGHGWATGNFFDTATRSLSRDDQMVIEYCQYAIDATVHVADRWISVLSADTASIERWAGVRDQVWADMGAIVQRRDRAEPVIR